MHTENVFSNSSLPEICRSTMVPTDQLPVWQMGFLLRFVKLCASFVKIPFRVRLAIRVSGSSLAAVHDGALVRVLQWHLQGFSRQYHHENRTAD